MLIRHEETSDGLRQTKFQINEKYEVNFGMFIEMIIENIIKFKKKLLE